MSAFIISLDFELFWGVADIADMKSYGANVEGEWQAVPAMLALFRRYGVRASWATVGMAMCRDYRHWQSLRPAVMPAYRNWRLSAYAYGGMAQAHPRLFFARPLVEQILETPGQELASHTYSHYLCNEEGASPDQFAADMACATDIAADLGIELRSLVMPRNQIHPRYLDRLSKLGIRVVRGNADHWLYRNGHQAPGGIAGRAVRLADAWLPLHSATVQAGRFENDLINVPASLFLRPWSRTLAGLEALRMHRLQTSMTQAARSDGVFHLWWHPHNFGVNQAENLRFLDGVLQHYARLRGEFGMRSMAMRDFEQSQDH